MNIQLECKNETEKRILDYLTENASETLADKINTGKKTLAGCLKYCAEQAKKKSSTGYACIEDKVVFGWAVHFFEEDEIKEAVQKKEAPKYEEKTVMQEYKERTEQKKEPEKKTDQLEGQTNIFDWARERGV